ncbi:MAG TPA: sulfite exporter TauE/SafE family protein [Burkholderiaceae bacterium]|nr:sulfite exporter TauE/SafE family protein [Burkholderiaceae bacterium]
MLQAGFLLITAFSVLATSFISGIFGMAGGMILMGVLVAFMPVSAAMVLHGAAQLTSNGWRAFLWRTHVDVRIFGRFLVGLLLAGLLFAFIGFIPDRALVLITLGVVPFLVLAIPRRFVPQVTTRGGAEMCGFLNTAMQFLAGVSGPLLDIFYVRTDMDRRVVVATKAACQACAHLAKLVYFGQALSGSDSLPALVVGLAVGCAIIGTSLSKFVLERLNDKQFRRWTQVLVMAIGTVYLVQGVHLLMTR